jgi:hypothetical protein
LAGPVSVVLLDPAQEGERARFAKWDIGALQAEQCMQISAKVKGIHLRLPWPDRPPANAEMQLYVRYTTVDGRRLEAQREMYLTLQGQITQRWTPRSPRRADGAEAEAPREKSDDGTSNPGTRHSTDVQSGLAEPQADEPSLMAPAAPLAAPIWRPDRPIAR